MGKAAQFVRSLFQRTTLPLPTGDPWFARYGLPRERSYLNDVGDGSNSNLVVPAVDFIANGFVEAPVVITEERDGEKQVLRDHPMTQQLRRPNPYYSGALIWMPTVANWISDGNAYWLPEFSGAGRPAAFYWIPSWVIEPKANERGVLSHYEYKPGGNAGVIRLDPREVVHFRWGLDPKNPLKGFSRLKAVLREIYSDEEAARFTAALLRNYGVPGLVLSPKGEATMSFEEAQDRKRELIQQTTGDRRGEPLVFTVETSADTFGFSPDELDLSRLRAIPESRVSAALGIPAAVLGFLAGMEQTKVGATMAELRELAYEQGVIPKMRLFAEELATQVLPHYTATPDRFGVEFDVSGVRVLQEDENKRHERLINEARAGLRTRASFKMAIGEKPEPGDDVYMLPINVIEVAPGEVRREAEPLRVAASRTMARKATPQQLAYLRQTEAAGQRLTPAFAGELLRVFGDLGERAAQAYEAAPQAFQRDPSDEITVEAILAALALDDWRIAILEPLWRTHYLRTAQMTYEALRLNLAVDIGTDLPDHVAREVIRAGGRQLGLVDLSESTRHALFEALAVAREEGLGPIEASRRLRRYVGAGRFTAMEAAQQGAGVRYRAELIARTETLHAQRVSVAEAGRAAGFTRYLAFDNRTGFGDPECVARDGRTFSYDEMLAEAAAEHPNGTLSFAPVPGSQLEHRPAEVVRTVEYDARGNVLRTYEQSKELVG